VTDIDSLAAALFGSKRAESQEVLTDATTRTYVGTALTDSKDGTVMVDLGGDVTLPDDVEGVSEHSAEGIEVSTGPGVRAGDEVVVTLVGGTPLKTPMVTGVAGEGDDQDARIATASAAAEEAWQWADEAHTAATEAQESADAAQESASSAASAAARAEQSAQQAIGDAARAESAAQQATEDAADAAQAAGEAKTSAQQAIEEANEAHDAATAAQAEASRASQSATEAKGAATRANTAANDALAQVSTVEDVIGVVDWVTEHGTYSLTTDTAIDPDKVYYTRSGSGTQADPYLYAAVPEPVAEDLGTYYELSVQEALSQYVASHLALTDAGLYVLKDGSGYRLLLANDGMQVIDPAGHTVATYGESITFDSERPQRIGGTDSYIEWRDTDSDGVPDSLAIVADSIELGSGQSVSTGSGNVWANHTSATSASGISSWSDTFVAPTTAKPYVWMKSYSIIDGQRVYGNPACITGAKGADGTSVSVTSIEYATSTTESQPSSGWSTTAPSTVAEGSWLWTKVNYSDGSAAVSRAKQGKSGTSGSSSYTHIRYSAQADGTGFVSTPTASTVYVGIAVTSSSSAPTAKGSYTWSRYVGQQGPQGPQGKTGETGVGVESYAQMWAKSTSKTTAPTSGWSESRPTSIGTNEYLWVRIDTTWTDGSTTQGTPVVDLNVTDLWHTSAALRVDVDSIDSDVSALQTTVSGHTATITQHATAIEQNATDIALRATKTEAYQIAQPNLSPYFSACQNTDFFTNSNYPVISAELGTIGTQLSDGWLHVDMDNSARSDAAYLNTWLKKPSWAKNSTEYTWLIEVRNFTLTSGSYIRFSPAQGNSAAQTSVTGYRDVTANDSYYVKSTTKADATTNSAYTTFSRGLIQANAGVSASFDVRYSVYEGDYSGPYKPYGGDGFYATSAELKVANDAISSKVSTTDYSGATIASLINQSADTVQILAQHIQLNGEVTFGAIESYADAKYDAIGAADAVQVGGRNLLQREWRVDDSGDKSGITYTCNADGSITLNGTSMAQHVFILARSLTLSAGTYTLSGCPAGGGTNSYRLDILTVPVSGGTTETKADNGNGVTFETPGGTTGQVRIRVVSGQTLSNLTFWPKLERGNRATDWSPAPEDVTTALAGTNESLSDTNDRLETLDGSLTAATIATGVSLNKIRDSITSLQGGLSAEIDAREQWLNFKASEGLRIGENGSAFHTLITSTSMEFKNGGTTLATASGSEFEAPVMSVTDELHMGGWMWTRRDNGNLSLKWIG